MPWIVVGELDRLKRTNDRQKARRAIKELLRQLPEDVQKRSLLCKSPTQVWPGVTLETLVPDRDHQTLHTADEEIVDQVRNLQDISQCPVRIVTEDAGMMLIARREGVKLQEVSEPARL